MLRTCADRIATTHLSRLLKNRRWLAPAWCLVAFPALVLAQSAPPAANSDAVKQIPELSGFWQLWFDSKSVPRALLTPLASRQQPVHDRADIDALRWCRLVGMPYMMQAPQIDVRQHGAEIVIVSPANSIARHIYIDGRSHVDPDAFDATTVGNSVGVWQNDELLVDTVGFSEQGVTGIPGGGFRTGHSHLVERYRLRDSGRQLDVTFTWTDQRVFRQPQVYEFIYHRATVVPTATTGDCDPFDPDRSRFFAPAMRRSHPIS